MKIISIFYFLYCTVLGANAAVPAPHDQKECSDFQVEIPAFFTKGYVEVPEDWNQPKGQKIKIFYYGNLGENGEVPTVFFNGGPTFSSHVSFGQIQTNSNSSNLPIIYIDQRGTGCSSGYPEATDSDSLKRINLYGSRNIVKDAEFIRKNLLKNKKWNVFGQSYGGLVAHRYLEVAPEGINQLFVHGNALFASWEKYYVYRLESQKRIFQEYLKKFPKDLDYANQIKKQIQPTDCFENETIKVCGNIVIDSGVFFLGMTSSWDELHFFLSSLLDKTTMQLNKSKLNKFVNALVLDVFSSSPISASAIANLEMTDAGSNREPCREAMAYLEANGQNAETWVLNECRLATQVVYKKTNSLDDRLNSLPVEKDILNQMLIQKNLSKYPIRFHLFSGHLDAFVPEESYVDEVRSLSKRINYINFESSGHDGFLTEPAIWELVKEASRAKSN